MKNDFICMQRDRGTEIEETMVNCLQRRSMKVERQAIKWSVIQIKKEKIQIRREKK